MYKLRPYQQEAVQRTLQYFRVKADPAVIVLPTGAGKSIVIAELTRLAKGRVLVLAHVKELVEQNHHKYTSLGHRAGIYSAGLNQKDCGDKAIFGSIQSVANTEESFFTDFTLLVIDECHRVSLESDSQYAVVIKRLRQNNPHIRILGLTATPYRLGLGWIYNHHYKGMIQTSEERFFKNCIYELSLEYMVRQRYLTTPIKIDIPVTCYDFSELTEKGRMYTSAEVEELLMRQRRLTPLIIKNIIHITESYKRQGVMIFSSTVKHAQEIASYLPEDQVQVILGDTMASSRDQIIEDFKQKRFKYLVNVSVLTTGFDAPHVDVIAIMRPTESVSLYQQIIGRGLRLDQDKRDCFVLDYTGMGHDIFTPEVSDKKPSAESVPVPVLVPCPECGFENTFWGKMSDDGEVIEHYGRKCHGGTQNPETYEILPCGYRFRLKICGKCGAENDISARECSECHNTFVDADSKLKQARLSKDAHIIRPDSIKLQERVDKKGNPFLEIKYFDCDAKYLAEYHFLNSETGFKKFHINFLRSHMRRPELSEGIQSVQDLIKYQKLLRMPSYVIGRKQGEFWRITEKIFVEEL